MFCLLLSFACSDTPLDPLLKWLKNMSQILSEYCQNWLNRIRRYIEIFNGNIFRLNYRETMVLAIRFTNSKSSNQQITKILNFIFSCPKKCKAVIQVFDILNKNWLGGKVILMLSKKGLKIITVFKTPEAIPNVRKSSCESSLA